MMQKATSITQNNIISSINTQCLECGTEFIIDDKSYLWCPHCSNIAPLSFEEYLDVFLYLAEIVVRKSEGETL